MTQREAGIVPADSMVDSRYPKRYGISDDI